MRMHAASFPRTAYALEAFGLLLALATVYLFRDCVVDDAYISLTYAANFLAGDGLVFNAGERVEGFTNLGFLLPVTALGALGVDLVVAARALGMFGAAIAVWLGPLAVLPGEEHRLARGLARLWILSTFAFVYLAWTGLETGFYAGLVALLVYRLRRDELRIGAVTGLVGGALFATRPDGALVVAALGLLVLRHGGIREVARMPGVWTLAAVVLGVEIFRWSYYGALVPHTAVVKGMMSRAGGSTVPWYGTFGDDVVEFFAETGGVLALLLVARALRPGAADPRGARLGVAAFVALASFTVYAGGDWMLGYRYVCPALPLYTSLAAAGAVAIWPDDWRRGPGGVLALGLAAVTAVYGFSFGLRFRQDIRQYPQFVMTSRDMTAAAHWLREHYPPDTTLTCWRIGALRYWSGMRVIDTNGLTDAGVAQRLADPAALQAHLAERAPRLALVRGLPGEPAPPTQEMYGGVYRFVQEFPQGDTQTWRLYERR